MVVVVVVGLLGDVDGIWCAKVAIVMLKLKMHQGIWNGNGRMFSLAVPVPGAVSVSAAP